MVSKAPELNLAGFNLGEKKEIKESYAKVYDKAAEQLAKYGVTLVVDIQSFEKETKDQEQRKSIGNAVLGRHIPEIVSELEKWLKMSEDYTAAFNENVSEIFYTCPCFNEKNDRFFVDLKDKRLTLGLNGHYICYRLDWENVGKYFENNLQFISKDDKCSLNLEGLNLGLQKEIKDNYAKNYPNAAKELAPFGITLTIDIPSFEYNTREKDERKNIGSTVMDRQIKDLVSATVSWAKKSSDYADALKENVSEIVLSGSTHDGKKDRISFELKDKILNARLNCHFINYRLDWEDVGKYLENVL